MKKIKYVYTLLAILIVGFLVFNNFDTVKYKAIDIYNDILEYANKSGLDELKAKGYLIDNSHMDFLKDSGITGDNVTINADFYPYYNFLSSDEQIIYKQIYANAKNLSRTFVPSVSIKASSIKNIIEAVYNDHPEIFWFDTSYGYKYTEDGNCAQITLNFNSTARNIENSKNLFNSKANAIIKNATKFDTPYEKEKYVHDAINNRATYDKSAPLNQNAYSALVNGKTVCAGYARSFQYIMIKLEIPTYYVTGTANISHAWNIVALPDGYYNVDLTWDDTKSGDYNYFNLTDEQISKTHMRSSASNNLPSCTATTYQYR